VAGGRAVINFELLAKNDILVITPEARLSNPILRTSRKQSIH
jgi:hypothetical protein